MFLKAQLKIDSVSIPVSFFARDISPRVNIGSMKCTPRLLPLSNIFLLSYTKTKTKKLHKDKDEEKDKNKDKDNSITTNINSPTTINNTKATIAFCKTFSILATKIIRDFILIWERQPWFWEKHICPM